LGTKFIFFKYTASSIASGQITARMRTHQIGNQKLIFLELAVFHLILRHKSFVGFLAWLTHGIQHFIGNMLWRNLELTGNMVFD
jgi:hypothetical protein